MQIRIQTIEQVITHIGLNITGQIIIKRPHLCFFFRRRLADLEKQGLVYFEYSFMLNPRCCPRFQNEIRKCDHSNESYWAVLYCGTVYHAVQLVALTFLSVIEFD